MNGLVSLIGAGPGNPELLTLLGKRRLEEADVIVYDRLVNPAMLAPYAAEKIDVGKLPLHHKVSQYQINDMLMDLSKAGKRVARLKAGDPYVFGRGGEEGQYLSKNKIPFEVVPGLTSAIAGLAAAGIPITHRDFASSFHVITGHRKSNGKELDWENIAHQEGTIVFLMGMAQLPTITQELMAHGMADTTPVAVVQWATHWKQRAVSSDLANIVKLVEETKITSPALIVVGGVVQLMGDLQPHQPLQGLHLLIPYKQDSKLCNALQDEGAAVNFFDRRVKRPLAFDLPDFNAGGTLIVIDFAAFHYFQERLLTMGIDNRALTNWKLVACNHIVKYRLQQDGLLADELYDPQKLDYQRPVVFIGEKTALTSYKPAIKADYLATYQSETVDQSIDLNAFHGIVFPSSAAVADLYTGCTSDEQELMRHMRCFAMGQTVADECQKRGLQNVIEVKPSYDNVIQTVRKVFAR
ncbi:uroporphyrinogen-III C-methyltransferase [Secundilactobacillus paracollinoides]|uniref:uroporphyrinogen-III C-methyltransferase n=1 Tax=Secundilactobacillus paracollinoides TaxID=240427 RepID=UPI0006D29A85|nr:uroporphyrinogen-III C-methyltransferase [Secundilactobacillus paracollinoides]KRL76090.1 uroporphyrinogen-III C-methyltransferase [Secundilactobacillus paracollinoides DSM 15502 = JCM 11969]